jgi:hypothetical protein
MTGELVGSTEDLNDETGRSWRDLEWHEDLPEPWERCYYTEIDRHVQWFYTEAAADRYIERNRHKLERPWTYVTSLRINHEMRKVRALLLALAEVVGGDHE